MPFRLPSVMLAFSLLAVAQEPARVHHRPKLAVVLEGGGALGLAHIGILQWMEEHHIPIDYVAGTSMGGLVGGAYSTGMSPREVGDVVEHIDWDKVLRASVEFEDLSFRRKEDRREFPTGLEFGLRHGAKLPAGFNSGQQIEFILDRIALPYSTVKSFDDLPIPFRCVAADLVSRSMHVFKDGSLSRALRSTMSIPGLFTPVKDEGRIYVDGGLLDNLPTDVAKDMGADAIIAIHLQPPLLSPDAVLSAFAVLAESFSVVTAVNEQRGMELADLVVRVDLTQFSGTDYNKAEQLIAAGYRAAQENSAGLLKFAVDAGEWRAYVAQRDARKIKSLPVPALIKVKGTTPQVAELMERQLEKYEGQPINEAQLEHELNILAGTGRFESLSYEIAEVGGRPGLRIDAVEKEYAPPTVYPVILVNGSQYDNVLFTVGARFSFLDVGKTGAEVRLDVLAGSTYRLAPEYFRPLARSLHWFIAPRGNIESLPVNLYSHNTQLAAYRFSQVNGGFDLGYMFDRFSELRAGYDVGWQNYSVYVGNPTVLPQVSGRQGLASIRYVLDHLNEAVVPTKGVGGASEFDFYDSRPGAADKFPALQITAEFFKPVRRDDSVYFTASGGTTFGFTKTGVPPFTLGGPFRLSAYGTNEIFTNEYLFFQGGYLHQLGELPAFLGKKVYFSSLYEIARPYGTRGGISDLPMDGAAGIIAETILGPAYIGGSWGDSGHRKIFFALGRIF